jgi:hypothetical protein
VKKTLFQQALAGERGQTKTLLDDTKVNQPPFTLGGKLPYARQ